MTRLVFLGLLTLALAGCGTTANLHLPKEAFGPPQLEVYGGVSNTVKGIGLNAEKEGVAPKLVTTVLVLDLPLSAVADTLTLPLTACVTVYRAIYGTRYVGPGPPPIPGTHEDRRRFPADDQPKELTPERIHGGII